MLVLSSAKYIIGVVGHEPPTLQFLSKGKAQQLSGHLDTQNGVESFLQNVFDGHVVTHCRFIYYAKVPSGQAKYFLKITAHTFLVRGSDCSEVTEITGGTRDYALEVDRVVEGHIGRGRTGLGACLITIEPIPS